MIAASTETHSDGTRRYRIVCRVIGTGFVTEGVSTLSKSVAEAWLKELNEKWGGVLDHWLVEVVE